MQKEAVGSNSGFSQKDTDKIFQNVYPCAHGDLKEQKILEFVKNNFLSLYSPKISSKGAP